MAAPSGTAWGSIVGGYGRIGIYTSVSNTNATTAKLTVQIWFWSKYSVIDSSNLLSMRVTDSAGKEIYSDIKTSTINTTVANGDGWSTSNQFEYAKWEFSYTRSSTAETKHIKAELANIDRVGGTMYASTTFTIPGTASYTITYNANGGKNAPSSQTKNHDANLTLSTHKPTRTGYSFQGWATSASGSVAYASGALYTGNASLSLYAVWTANTYTVTYNANGGSGAPPNQTKTYGTTLKLSTAKPTRTNYTFLGWATSKSATTAAYAAGENYTTNASVTLYAVWELSYVKPKIWSLSADRCNSAGASSDEGTYAVIAFNWSTSVSISSIKIAWVDSTGSTSGSTTATVSGTSGTVSKVVGGSFDVETSYIFTITIADGTSTVDRSVTMSGAEYHIDFGENAVAIGKPAENLIGSSGSTEKTLDVDWRAKFRNNICVGDKLYYHDGKQGALLTFEGFLHLQRTSAQGYHPYIGFYIDDATSANGQIRLNSGTKVMEFLSAAGYKFGNDVNVAGDLELSTNKKILYGVDPNGLRKNAFQAQNENGNTIVGYGNYTNASGNTNIYGHDINFGVANIASPGTYRPYRRRGDTLTITFRGAGYVTNAGTEVSFWIPVSEPIIGSPVVTVNSTTGFVLRQGNKYTHGSTASFFVIPDSLEATATMHHGVYIKAVFSNTTNVTNNDTIGIYWAGNIIFS
jgi:uncharacterized repeat protein (TIGR02543 family)